MSSEHHHSDSSDNHLPVVAAFIRLLLSGALFRFAFRILRNEAEAQEAVGQTGIVVLRGEFDEGRGYKPETYIFSVLLNKCRDILRRLGRSLASLDQVIEGGGQPPSDDLGPDGIAEQVEIGSVVHQALARLANSHPNYAMAIRLRYIEGLSIAEVAAKMGVNPNNVYQLVHRGLETLLDLLIEPTMSPVPCMVADAVAKLPVHLLIPFVLHSYMRFTVPEVAKVLGIEKPPKEANAEVRLLLNEAKRQLHSLVGDELFHSL